MRDGVERLAVDELAQDMDFLDPEKPVLLWFQSIDFDQAGVVEHVGYHELVPGLSDVFLVLRILDDDHLQGIVGRIGSTRTFRMVLCAPLPKGLMT